MFFVVLLKGISILSFLSLKLLLKLGMINLGIFCGFMRINFIVFFKFVRWMINCLLIILVFFLDGRWNFIVNV